jgi:hypothetical protein
MRIILAWWYWLTNRNDEIAQYRLKICAHCELLKWGVCTVCGCPIVAKSRLLDESCPHPMGDKWEIKNPDSVAKAGG